MMNRRNFLKAGSLAAATASIAASLPAFAASSKRLGRITSYNVCYTKLLRPGVFMVAPLALAAM